MKNDVFIPTQNFQKFENLCIDLLSTSLGIEMAAVMGRAGRGKSTAAERVVTNMPQAVYVRFEERFSYVGLIREIAFRVAGFRPRSTDVCVDHIKEELARERKLIIVDEADRMSMKHLNTMRDFHDVCGVPVVLIGEELLHKHLQRERRLESRVREEMMFEPISQADVAIFYRKALDQAIKPEMSAKLLRHGEGDWRIVIKDAVKAERYMKASGIRDINEAVIREVLKDVDK